MLLSNYDLLNRDQEEGAGLLARLAPSLPVDTPQAPTAPFEFNRIQPEDLQTAARETRSISRPTPVQPPQAPTAPGLQLEPESIDPLAVQNSVDPVATAGNVVTGAALNETTGNLLPSLDNLVPDSVSNILPDWLQLGGSTPGAPEGSVGVGVGGPTGAESGFSLPGLVDTAGGAYAITNTLNEIFEMGHGNREDNIQGVTSTAGAVGGYVIGGPVGAAIGSKVGSVVADVLNSIFNNTNPRADNRKNITNMFTDMLGGEGADTRLGQGATFTGVGGRQLEIERFDFGLDSKEQQQIKGKLWDDTVAMVDPFAETLAISYAERQGITDPTKIREFREDFGALISKAVVDGSQNMNDVRNNILYLMKNELGMTATDVKKAINYLYTNKLIDQNRFETYALTLALS